MRLQSHSRQLTNSCLLTRGGPPLPAPSKLSYCDHFHLEEPDTMAVLTFGAISGGVGATSVYRAFRLSFEAHASSDLR